MKSLIAANAISLLLIFSSTAEAQTRSRRTAAPSPPAATQKRRTASATTSRTNTTQSNAARLKLADQLKTLTRFIYVYGRFSKDLELTGAQGETSEATAKTRAALLQNLRNVREGLDQLEGQFRFTPGLERQFQLLNGVARRAEAAENMAAAGQLDQAGRTLVDVISQLTDVLSDM